LVFTAAARSRRSVPRPYAARRLHALFYTGVIGAGGFAPIAYGAIADHSNRTVGILAAALTAAVIVPLVLALRPILKDERGALAEQES
jgi:MFS transporter, FSR family, fosmidomycin resistance protein